MREIKVTAQTFLEIKSSGHGVPRDANREIQTGFRVGSEYIISCTQLPGETLKVRCTQDSPHHLKVID